MTSLKLAIADGASDVSCRVLAAPCSAYSLHQQCPPSEPESSSEVSLGWNQSPLPAQTHRGGVKTDGGSGSGTSGHAVQAGVHRDREAPQIGCWAV